jgi:predicted enzyme related to lactoylglutathione lyase
MLAGFITPLFKIGVTTMSQPCSKFVWYELMTSDAQAAAAFYRSVVGWDTKDADMPGSDYTLFLAKGTDVGGLMTLPEQACAMGVPPCWTGYVSVDDVDAYTARVKAAGGQLVREPEDIPGVGRFAVVTDPYGAVFNLFKDYSGQTPAPIEPDAPGRVGWHELHAGDGAGAFAFYSSLFRWTRAEAMDMGPLGVYQMFAIDGVPVGGMMTKTAEVAQPFWLYYFNVAALDAAVARVTEGGGKLLVEPHEVPGGSWIVNCTDPQGAVFALVAPKR